jgi:hypothetical protein
LGVELYLVVLVLVAAAVGSLLTLALVWAVAWAVWRTPRRLLRAACAASPTIEVAVLTVAEDLVAEADASTPIDGSARKYRLH